LHINEVASRKLFFELGYESLYMYLTKGLKYSESAAYRRIQAAKMLMASPLVAEKIESGALNLSQLTQVQKCLKEEKKKGISVEPEKISEVLFAIEGQNTFESEKILAKEFNQSVKTTESIKPQRDDSVRLELTLTAEQFEILKQAKQLLSHQCPDGNWNEVITSLAEKFNQSKLGTNNKRGKNKNQVGTSDEKTQAPKDAKDAKTQESMLQSFSATKKISQLRDDHTHSSQQAVEAKEQQENQTFPKAKKYRQELPVKIRRQVFSRAEHRCEFTDSKTGARCTSKFQLEVDHRKPLALGGGDELENLRVLCRVHNQQAWRLSSGA
jgi:hypothetical protein